MEETQAKPPTIQEVIANCVANGGHVYEFAHGTITGHNVSRCTRCGLARIDRPEESAHA